MPNLKSLKKKLRERIHVMLRAEAAQECPRASEAVRDLFLAHFTSLPAGAVVSGTMPIKGEVNPHPLMRALEEKGLRLCLPVTGAHATPLVFRAYRFGDALEKGVWNIETPFASQPELEPDVLLCPLLAFDRTGGRLGYGGGYYDATLHKLRAKKAIMAIGLGFAAQEVEEVPVGPLDQRLDAIVTEKEVIIPVSRSGQL